MGRKAQYTTQQKEMIIEELKNNPSQYGMGD